MLKNRVCAFVQKREQSVVHSRNCRYFNIKVEDNIDMFCHYEGKFLIPQQESTFLTLPRPSDQHYT